MLPAQSVSHCAQLALLQQRLCSGRQCSSSQRHCEPASRATSQCWPKRSTSLAATQPKAAYLDLEEELENTGTPASLQTRMVQWYPGHIARAERQLKEQLRMVDMVVEVRDARIPESTRHPEIPAWIGSKARVIVLNRVDMVSEAAKQAWAQHFAKAGHTALWTNSVSGDGVLKVSKAAAGASKRINAARHGRGLQPRPVRAVVLGFPNVGKSALINRLLGRRVCQSAPKPGVTRHLKWLRLGADLDLLDTPGVLPMSFNDQTAAQRLAMCNDIGEAAYLDSLVAAALFETLQGLPDSRAIAAALVQRYGVEPRGCSGEDYVAALGEKLFGGDAERGGQRLLKDFRTGKLGRIALELPH